VLHSGCFPPSRSRIIPVRMFSIHIRKDYWQEQCDRFGLWVTNTFCPLFDLDDHRTEQLGRPSANGAEHQRLHYILHGCF
jgi:hypothetical protein